MYIATADCRHLGLQGRFPFSAVGCSTGPTPADQVRHGIACVTGPTLELRRCRCYFLLCDQNRTKLRESELKQGTLEKCIRQVRPIIYAGADQCPAMPKDFEALVAQARTRLFVNSSCGCDAHSLKSCVRIGKLYRSAGKA